MKHFLLLLLSAIVSLTGSAQDKKFQVIQFEIREEIAPSATRIVSKALQAAVDSNADLVIIHMNTYGGLLNDGDSIRQAILNSTIPVWVFIDKNAASAGALIAIACDKIFMAPGSSMGSATVVDGSGAVLPDKYQSYMRSMMRATAESHGADTIINGQDTVIKYKRDPLIAEAMVDPRTVVPGLIDSTKVLAFTPEEAIKYNYCEGKYLSITDVLKGEGIASYKITKVEKSQMDKIIGFLANPAISGVLISIILFGIFFELRTPGVGFPLAAAVLAAFLYFAPLYLEGLAANWEILVFIAGLALIALELFVLPGFGVAGISGIFLMVSALVLSMVRNIQFDFTFTTSAQLNTALAVVLGALLAFVGLTFLFGRTMLNNPVFRRLILADTLEGARVGTQNISGNDPMQKEGIAFTDLRPMGKVKIEGVIYNARTYGGFIEKGSTIRVIGNEYGYLLVEDLPVA